MNITTRYKTNHNGASQILAKGGGKQRTTNYDPAHSADWNHGTAAGVLVIAVHGPELAKSMGRDMSTNVNVSHENPEPATHRFTL